MSPKLQRAVAIVLAAAAATTAAIATARTVDLKIDRYGSAAELRARIAAARAQLLGHLQDVDARSKMAGALQTRLDGDAAELDEGFKPSTMSSDDFWSANALRVHLDTNLVDQLTTGALHDAATVRGADDILVRSADGTLQPVALYVPPTYVAGIAAPLVVFLHGRTVTESDLLATPFLRGLADGAGVIVVAPYGRGDLQYADPAPGEIYQALDVVEHAFNVDHRRIFLAGHSMGATAVFHIGALHPQRWSGFLIVSGYLLKSDADLVLKAFAAKPVSVVAGSSDTVAPVESIRKTVRGLEGAGVPVHYFEEPGGAHSLGSVYPSLVRAWRELLGVKVPPHPPSGLTQRPIVPTPTPSPFGPTPVPTLGGKPAPP